MLPLFALQVAAFSVQHTPPNSFGQSAYINWSLIAIKGMHPIFPPLHFPESWTIVSLELEGGDPNNKKRKCSVSSVPYGTKFWTSHKMDFFFLLNICPKMPPFIYFCFLGSSLHCSVLHSALQKRGRQNIICKLGITEVQPLPHDSLQLLADGMAHLLLPTSLVSSDVCSSPTCPCRPLWTALPGFIQLESVLPSVSVMFLVWWMLLLRSVFV